MGRMGQQKGGGGAPERASAATRPISVELVVEVLCGVARVDFMRSAAYGSGLRRDAVEAGLTGYNGCLVALGCAVLLGPGHPATVVVAVLGAVVAVVATADSGPCWKDAGCPRWQRRSAWSRRPPRPPRPPRPCWPRRSARSPRRSAATPSRGRSC
ncbi:urea transporter [Kitasatospora aureofaciens]|uniref:urea transporter n=1 Tax=Kitasatospora aureofaciens TaxID=1894 RepID=UPI0037C60A6B